MAVKPMTGAGLLYVLVLLCDPFHHSLCFGINDPRDLFYDHAVVHPSIFSSVNREKRDLYREELHEDKLTLEFVAFNRTYTVKLQRNNELFPDFYFEKHHDKNGRYIIERPMQKKRNRTQPTRNCHYQGYLEDAGDHSWAAISTCYGVSGIIFDGSDVHYIEPNHYFNANHHYLFRSSDMREHNFKCGVSAYESFPTQNLILERLRRQRHRRSAVLQEPYKSNRNSRFLELVIVNDNLEFKKFNKSKSVVFERSKQIANIVNALYSPLNIFIALVGVIVWSEHDEIKLSSDGEVTLTNFLHYRRERLAQEHPNDNAQLITAMSFDGGVVGKALKGPICTFEYSGGVNVDHNELVGLVATTVAHELGHNFGMEHDTDQCKCPNDKCIMSPSSSSTSPRHWSSCSLEYLDVAYSQGMEYCLRNKPTNIIGPLCGNGFLEEGEECDCGLEEFCQNPCCNASTCKLHGNATCAIGVCCDVSTCEIKKTAVLCRESASECDLPEYCDGKSEFCPPDTYTQNGELCGDSKAFCYEGQCRSHANQCKLLWGETGRMSDDRCYEQNHKGDVNGNCGYNRLNNTYKACRKPDILCGTLHCTHLNEKLEFGMESAATLARSYITVNGRILTCRSAIVDLGLYDTDPGLVPDGAKCGEGKVCVKQKCVSIETIKGAGCPLGCSGNGVCNNKGNCHCSVGYGPPYCNAYGPGGSIDSGPASDPEGYGVVIALYVIFLGLIPLVVISAGAMYYFRPHFKAWWIAKARKANIKCRAKQTIQKKPQPPSKFNFDRNSLRTLEISAPIQQVQANTNSAGHLYTQKDKPAHFVESCAAHASANNTLHTNRPVRPAPPRPNITHQRTPSWTPATSTISRAVVRTSSLKVPDDNPTSRPLSMSATRPNCPPPRPPPPNPSSAAPKHVSSCNYDISMNDAVRCATPSSAIYDDCETLDFSNTALAFVHQNKPHFSTQQNNQTTSSQDKPQKEVHAKHSSLMNPKQLFNKTNSKEPKNTIAKPVFQCSGRTGPSVVASLAKKFEQQNPSLNAAMAENPSQMKPPFKTRPLPPTPNNLHK